MAENNIDKALAYLGTQINSLVDASKAPIDTSNLHKLLAKRSLSGDHLDGGTIVGFASTGIKDSATSKQLTVTDQAIQVTNLSASGDITANTMTVDVLEVRELKTQTQLGGTPNFKASDSNPLSGQGFLWTGEGNTKQFIFRAKPDRFYSTESLELGKDKDLKIDGNSVLSSTELGPTVINSNLRKLGRLQGLVVDGSVNIDQYLYFDSNTSRLGLGIEEPNSALSVAEDGIEVMLGTRDHTRGQVGTFASAGFDIVTDNTVRIAIGSNGNIQFGNTNAEPIQATMHGKLGVNVKSIDTRADLHVAGSIKFADRLHQYADSVPQYGTFGRGDIVWNTQPAAGSCIGWVCVSSGAPGMWLPFGEIKAN